MRFAKNDIVVSLPPYSAGVYVITATDPSRPKNCYTAKNVATGKGYRLADDGLAKVGVADAAYVANGYQCTKGDGSTVESKQYTDGQRFASRNNHVPAYAFLATLKPGDIITVVDGHGTRRAVPFNHVMVGGIKYAFVAGRYKWQLKALVLPGADKKPLFGSVPVMAPKPPGRSESEILEDFRSVEVQLSPENLTCDGELPRHEVLRRQRELLAQKQALILELGREPSFTDLYPELAARVNRPYGEGL